MQDLSPLLEASRALHSHLCPRQVLGVRMALAGAQAVGLDVPRTDKALLVIAETDGCFLDGLMVAAGVSPGHRTLRVEDYGKIAATFANVSTGEAVRVALCSDIRARAVAYAPGATCRYAAQLVGYQVMPDEALFSLTAVSLTPALPQIISRAGARAHCARCGEDIINEREIIVDGLAYCRSCLGPSYYQTIGVAIPRRIPQTELDSPVSGPWLRT
jgi:formylmethanofuran dehydrogenase subunit E